MQPPPPTVDDVRAVDPVTDGAPAAPLDVLRRVFGYEAFRGDQAEIIDTVVAGGDALVLMPTGGGSPCATRSLRWSGPAPASSSPP
ncbi:hypothetical protein LJB74_07985 [Cellulomonas sp. P24]|nr:hypothetical protein [Cellulomonas sp. P24]